MPPPVPDLKPPRPDLFERHPLLLLVLFTLAFYWKLALSSQFTFLETPDLAYQVLPWYQFQAKMWHSGVFPLWDPFQWSGQSLLGQMQPGAAFPLNWPLFLAPLQNGYLNFAWVHRHFVLMHFLAALFMYAFCRRLGSSRFACVIAGSAFSFGGYLGNTPWPQMLEGALWIPLVFLFFDRMVEREEGLGAVCDAVLCGGAIGLSLLSGHHQAPMFALLALGGLTLYYLYTRPGFRWILFRRLAVAGSFAFLVGALQLLPAWEYGAHSYRWVDLPDPVRMQDTVPYFAQYKLGIFPLSFLGTLFPKAHLTTDPFLGFVCLSFAFFAVAAGWGDRKVRIYSVLALGGIAYTAGHYSLFHGLVYTALPFIDKARSPGHAVFVFQFAVLILTARGIDLFFSFVPQQAEWELWRRRILKFLVGVGLLSWALLFWLFLNLKFEIDPGDHVILSSLVAFVLAAVLHGLHRGHLSPLAVRVSVALLLLFELSITSYFFISHRADPKRAVFLKHLTDSKDLTDFLKSQPRPFRFDVSSQTDFPANLGDWEGIESTRGYLASVSGKLYDFVGWDWTRVSLVLNTTYYLGKQPSRPEQREVFSSPSGWKVFRNDDAYPRAWMVHRARTARDAREAADLFRSGVADPRQEAVLIAAAQPEPAPAPCPVAGTARITWYSIHRIEAQSNAACPGMVVFGEADFPGWQATVDGRAVPIHAPFGALRGIAVPAGAHVIEMVYRPMTVYAGAGLSLVGLLLCAAAGLVSIRRASS